MDSDGLEGLVTVSPIPGSVRERIAEALWKQPAKGRVVELPADAYFDYYTSQCRRFRHDGGRHVTVRSHADVLEIASLLRSGLSRADVHDHVKKSLASRERPAAADAKTIDRSVDLCVSLMLMVEVGEHEFGFWGLRPVCWADGALDRFVAKYFEPEAPLAVDNPRLGKLFTARNLTRIGGVGVRWTTNLADHLRLADDDQTVFIFHIAGFLQLQKSLESTMYPSGFVEETIRTLALLFPQNDADTRKWLSVQLGRQGIDETLGRCGSLTGFERRFEQFSFWHNRLVILKQAFDEAQPRTLLQSWADRRNLVQWCTFWAAILVFFFTLFFGMIQSVEGAIQVYLAYRALQLSG